MKRYTLGWYLGLMGLCMAVLLGCGDKPASDPEVEGEEKVSEALLYVIVPKLDHEEVYSGEAVQKVSFAEGESAKDLTLTDVQGHSVFLVKVNTQSSKVAAKDTGHGYTTPHAVSQNAGEGASRALSLPREDAGRAVSGNFVRGNQTFTRYDHTGAQEFTRNLPSLSPTRGLRENPLAAAALASLGDKRAFWVQDKADQWIQLPAVLRAVSPHSKVWVAEENYSELSEGETDNKLTQEQVQRFADKFEQIYQYETALFGYEYGGGLSPTDKRYGGVDGDPAVHILVYDIEYDYSPTQTMGVFGFYWAKDYYDQATLNTGQTTMKTNRAEIFYIDAFFSDIVADAIYSTLAHEFQHMINFNEKALQRQKISETWYDEMLSLLAEDVISPKIGIDYAN
ncbi:MAG: hypothetical protein LBD74_06590, partial [Spirochaetaceae bacterium]|nr:hypothetical protein [Spirochaetaceae bacterium]